MKNNLKKTLLILFGVLLTTYAVSHFTLEAALTNIPVDDLLNKLGAPIGDLVDKLTLFTSSKMPSLNYYKTYPRNEFVLSEQDYTELNGKTNYMVLEKEGICMHMYKNVLYKIDFFSGFPDNVFGIKIEDSKDRIEEIHGPATHKYSGGIIGEYGKEEGKWWDYNLDGKIVSCFISRADEQVKIISLHIPLKGIRALVKGGEQQSTEYQDIIVQLAGPRRWDLLWSRFQESTAIKNREDIGIIENIILPTFNQDLAFLSNNRETKVEYTSEQTAGFVQYIIASTNTKIIQLTNRIRKSVCRILINILANLPEKTITSILLLSKLYAYEHAYEKSLKILEEWLRTHKDSILLREVQADVLFMLGRWAEAKEEYERITRLYPNKRYSIRLGASYNGLGNIKKSNRFLKKLTCYKIRNYHELCTVGDCYVNAGNYYKALKYYRTTLRRNKYCLEAYHGLGAVYKRQGRMNRAMEYFKKSLLLNDSYIPSILGLGSVHILKGNISAGKELYEKALEISNRDKRVYCYYAIAYALRGLPDTARDIISQVSVEYVDDPLVLVTEGLLFQLSGKYHEAKKRFQTGLKNARGNYNWHYLLGILYQKQGRFNESIAEYEESLSQGFLNPETLYNTAMLYVLDGDTEKSKNELARIKDMDETCFWSYFGNGILNRDSPKEALGNFRKAMLYNDFVSAEVIYEYAFTLNLLQHLAEAAQWYKRVIKIDPEIKEASHNLRQILLHIMPPDKIIGQVRAAIVFQDDTLPMNKDFSVLLKKINQENLVSYIKFNDLAVAWENLKSSNYWNAFSNLNLWEMLGLNDAWDMIYSDIKSTFYIDFAWDNILSYCKRDGLMLILKNELKLPGVQFIAVFRKNGYMRDYEELLEKYGRDLVIQIEDKETVAPILNCGQLLKVAFVDGLFIVGITDMDTMKEVLAMLKNANNAEPIKNPTEGNPYGTVSFFINLDTCYQSQLRNPFSNINLTNSVHQRISTIKTDVEIYPRQIKYASYIKYSENSDLSLIKGTPQPLKSWLALLPQDISFAINNNSFRIDQMYNMFLKNLADQKTTQADSIINRISSFEKEWGIDLKNSLMPALGDSFCFLIINPAKKALIPFPQFVIIMKPVNKGAIDNAINKIVNKPLYTDKKTYKDVTLNSNFHWTREYNGIGVNSYGLEVGTTSSFSRSFLGISYVYLGPYLVVATGDDLVEKIIDRYRSTEENTSVTISECMKESLDTDINNSSYMHADKTIDMLVNFFDWSLSTGGENFTNSFGYPQSREKARLSALQYSMWNQYYLPFLETCRAFDDIFSYSIVTDANDIKGNGIITFKDISDEQIKTILASQTVGLSARPLVTIYSYSKDKTKTLQSGNLMEFHEELGQSNEQKKKVVDTLYIKGRPVIECNVTKIDEKCIYIRSAQGEESKYELNQVEAVFFKDDKMYSLYELYTEAPVYVNTMVEEEYIYEDVFRYNNGVKNTGEIVRATKKFIGIKENRGAEIKVGQLYAVDALSFGNKAYEENAAELFNLLEKIQKLPHELEKQEKEAFSQAMIQVESGDTFEDRSKSYPLPFKAGLTKEDILKGFEDDNWTDKFKGNFKIPSIVYPPDDRLILTQDFIYLLTKQKWIYHPIKQVIVYLIDDIAYDVIFPQSYKGTVYGIRIGDDIRLLLNMYGKPFKFYQGAVIRDNPTRHETTGLWYVYNINNNPVWFYMNDLGLITTISVMLDINTLNTILEKYDKSAINAMLDSEKTLGGKRPIEEKPWTKKIDKVQYDYTDVVKLDDGSEFRGEITKFDEKGYLGLMQENGSLSWYSFYKIQRIRSDDEWKINKLNEFKNISEKKGEPGEGAAEKETKSESEKKAQASDIGIKAADTIKTKDGKEITGQLISYKDKKYCIKTADSKESFYPISDISEIITNDDWKKLFFQRDIAKSNKIYNDIIIDKNGNKSRGEISRFGSGYIRLNRYDGAFVWIPLNQVAEIKCDY